MDLAITARQRNLLYDIVEDRLTGIDQVWWSVQSEDWPRAQRVGREYSSLLRLVVEDLGWGSNRQDGVTLKSPPDVLQDALEAIRREAAFESKEQRQLRLEAAEVQIDREDTLETCRELLAELGLLTDER